jgi:hypothetical protein
MNDIVYMAMYNPMTEESCYGIISIHKTRKGAEMAIEFHKAECRKIWEEDMKWRRKNTKNLGKEKQTEYLKMFSFGHFEAWNVFEQKLKQ